MEKHTVLLSLVAVLNFCCIAFAYEPAPLQDFCVADLNSPVTVNGFSCKNPMMVQANDFLFRGFNIPGNTSNPARSKVSPVTAAQLPGLNTFGIAMARVDYLPGGVNPPHYHPRASEIFTLIEGSLLVGFVTTNPENRLISKVLQKGDVFVFPKGLIHFQLNLGNEKALAIAALSSQNPGIMTVANAVFGSNPPISSEVLTKAFQTDKKVIDQILSKF